MSDESKYRILYAKDRPSWRGSHPAFSRPVTLRTAMALFQTMGDAFELVEVRKARPRPKPPVDDEPEPSPNVKAILAWLQTPEGRADSMRVIDALLLEPETH